MKLQPQTTTQDGHDWWCEINGAYATGRTRISAINQVLGMLIKRYASYIFQVQTEGIAHVSFINLYHWHGRFNTYYGLPGDFIQIKIFLGLGYVEFGFYLTRFWLKKKTNDEEIADNLQKLAEYDHDKDNLPPPADAGAGAA